MEMAKATPADSSKRGDLVFAQKRGYMPWPAKLIDNSDRLCGLVQFVNTNDRHLIPYAKIWTCNQRSKQEFITLQALQCEEFYEAILATELIDSQPPKGKQQQELLLLDTLLLYRNTLHVEPQFIEQVNKLRRCLTRHRQDYAAAQLAFQKLLELKPFSRLLLVRNREAVESIRKLVGFVNHTRPNPNEPQMVRYLAKRLIRRFAGVFSISTNISNFWSSYYMQADIYRRHARLSECDANPNKST
ncbi:uncharacterized protein LOC6568282 [Drosophila grimshawi]|uniref:GH13794 n=1 Tax=Drosophila grimshawi TaxID=7222 RepID=B4JTR1_DROGR|nr:uncharacterized protein LOC6568282 [Drosophila grimshawi]EDV91490.1 GH13794 [Drosophila grimshawi]